MSYAEQLKRDGHLLNRPPRPPKKRYDFSKKKSEWKAPLKRTRLKKVSVKREAQMKEYMKLREVFLTKNKTCEFPGCKSQSQDLHHKFGRIGVMLTAEHGFVALCRKHHDFIHANPSHGRRLGLLG